MDFDLSGLPECDTWAEDCPKGQKCMPVSLDGDNSWENLICVPIAPNPAQPGEPCSDLGTSVDGLDTCDKHAVCWNVDPDTQTGTCVSMCVGTPDTPACADPNATCILPSDGVLNLCLPNCDPIAQDCPNTDLCIPNPQDPASFLCILDASGAEGQTFDPCEFANACDPGKVCLAPDLASECDPMKDGCCLPFCDLSKPNTCPGQGLECLPWYKDGMAPPQYQNVGVCGLPMP